MHAILAELSFKILMMPEFTCKELAGICDEVFSGDTPEEVMQQGMGHMMGDDLDEAHAAHKKTLESKTPEDGEKWMAWFQAEFAKRKAAESGVAQEDEAAAGTPTATGEAEAEEGEE